MHPGMRAFRVQPSNMRSPRTAALLYYIIGAVLCCVMYSHCEFCVCVCFFSSLTRYDPASRAFAGPERVRLYYRKKPVG